MATRFAIVFVDRRFSGVCLMRPLDEIGEGSRCFRTASAESFGHETKKPAFIARIHVVLFGLKHAPWR